MAAPTILEPNIDEQCGFHLFVSFKDILAREGIAFRNFGPRASYELGNIRRELLKSDSVVLTSNTELHWLEALFGNTGDFVGQYVYERGGTLVIIFHPASPQDPQPWGPFLSHFKINTTPASLFLRDEHGETTSLLRFRRSDLCLANHILLEGVEDIVIDHPYCLITSPPQAPLVWAASGMRTLDWTLDLEDDFPTGKAATVMTVWEAIGDNGGRVLVLAQGSLDEDLIDSEEGNLRFCRNVAKWLAARSGIVESIPRHSPIVVEGERIISLLEGFPSEQSSIKGALNAYLTRAPDFGRQALNSLRNALENLAKRLSGRGDWQAGLDQLLQSETRKKTIKAAHMFLSGFGAHGASEPTESDLEHGFRMTFSALQFLLGQTRGAK